MKIDTNVWQPSNNIIIPKDIEKNILKNIDENIVVVAGPGSGKTEMLAQKASFLFETNLCKNPYKILALTYKVDAAKTLKDRVNKRCGHIANGRFDSLTLDAFLFSIVLRFYKLLPEWIAPLSQNLDMCFDDKSLSYNIYQASKLEQNKINTYISKNQLPWNLMRNMGYSILFNNSEVIKVVQSSYQFVFIDEFQDTTDIHYKILKLLFKSQDIKCMAVGDSKQAIMGFAGALDSIFVDYINDFSAKKYSMNYNYRSNSNIVEFLNNVIKQILLIDGNDILVACKQATDKNSVMQKGNYSNMQEQFRAIAKFISERIKHNDLKQHDFLLVKRTKILFDNLDEMNNIFSKYGLCIRNEMEIIYNKITIQDLMENQLSRLLIHIFAYNKRCITPVNYQELLQIYSMYKTYDINDNNNYDKVTREIIQLDKKIRELYDIEKIVKTIMGSFKVQNIINRDDDIKSKQDLNNIIIAFIKYFKILHDKSDTYNDAISQFYGENQIKIMTIHKSKGMEYDTVFFLDFNSKEWNIFKTGNNKSALDELKVFFVGISRAKNILVFTKNNTDHYPSDVESIIKSLPQFG